MQDASDIELLRQYAAKGENADLAFSTLVSRHINLVYTAALRHVSNSHHAEEITQAVFVILARKAASLRETTVLSGWLYQTARLTSANFLRTEIRRVRREQEAHMQALANETVDEDAWQQIAPILDDAMGQLGEKDRNAVVLRFFERRNLGEVGARMGVSEDAAKMRVNRALEKLRKIFLKRGVMLSAAAIATVVSAGSVQAAPAGLAGTVATTALHGAFSSVITLLVKGTMKTMTWLKLKVAVGTAMATLAVGGVATLALSGQTELSPADIVSKAQEKYSSLSSYIAEGETKSVVGSNQAPSHRFKIRLARPDLYRIEWEQPFFTRIHKGAAWSSGNGDFFRMRGRTNSHPDKNSTLAAAAGVSGSASVDIPGMFFNTDRGNHLGGSMKSSVRQENEQVEGINCYVLSRESNGRTITLWIGTDDFLLRKIRTHTSAATMNEIMEDAAKKHPELRNRLRDFGESISIRTYRNIVVNRPISKDEFEPTVSD